MKTFDMTGMEVGRLAVLRPAEAVNGRAVWVCMCSCGTEKAISGKHLRSGRVVSCGCKKKEQRVSEADQKARRTAYAKSNVDAARAAGRKYREANIEVVREKARAQQAEYRKTNASLGVLDAVRSVDDFWSRVDIGAEDSCWNWLGAKTARGYGLYAPMPGVLLRAHRVAYGLHNGGVDDGMFVCHKCDNPSCSNPNHLFLGTPKDNIDDMIQKGRNVVMLGEANPMSKLSREAVRRMFQDRRTNSAIASEYGVSSSLVSLIRRRRVWRNATSDLPDAPTRVYGPRTITTA